MCSTWVHDSDIMVADRTASEGDRVFQPDIRVAFVLSPSFTLLPFAGFVDTLRHAADDADRSRQIYCHWRILGPSLTPIRSSCGAEVSPWQLFDDPGLYDYVVIVGGLLCAFEQHAAQTFEFLRSAAERQVPVVGLCTGSFAMAEAGPARRKALFRSRPTSRAVRGAVSKRQGHHAGALHVRRRDDHVLRGYGRDRSCGGDHHASLR